LPYLALPSANCIFRI
jgi:hypothetical protein